MHTHSDRFSLKFTKLLEDKRTDCVQYESKISDAFYTSRCMMIRTIHHIIPSKMSILPLIYKIYTLNAYALCGHEINVFVTINVKCETCYDNIGIVILLHELPVEKYRIRTPNPSEWAFFVPHDTANLCHLFGIIYECLLL